MTDREGQERGRTGEMESGGVSPVLGDLERETTSPDGPGGRERRSATTRTLQGLAYPLARDDLVREAAVQGAGRGLLDRLSRVPNRTYVSAEDVARQLERPV